MQVKDEAVLAMRILASYGRALPDQTSVVVVVATPDGCGVASEGYAARGSIGIVDDLIRLIHSLTSGDA